MVAYAVHSEQHVVAEWCVSAWLPKKCFNEIGVINVLWFGEMLISWKNAICRNNTSEKYSGATSFSSCKLFQSFELWKS